MYNTKIPSIFYLFAVLLYLGPFLLISALWALSLVSAKWFLFAGIWFVVWVLWAWVERDQQGDRNTKEMKKAGLRGTGEPEN